MVCTSVSLLRGFQNQPELRPDPMLTDELLEAVWPQSALRNSVLFERLGVHNPILVVERHR
jgi:hypothetical protein